MESILLAVAVIAGSSPLRAELEPLRFLVGHCWTAEFPNRPGERDTQCFEPVFEGQHVRSRHKVSGASKPYEGETLFSYDGKQVTFTYWNSLGGVSTGSMRPDGGTLKFGDESYTGPDGRKLTFSTTWRRIDADTYEAVTTAPGSSELSRTMRYKRTSSKPPIR
jgi:hypothetical protein